jgi:3-hydroxy-3-methylglutaryl CoA synthase
MRSDARAVGIDRLHVDPGTLAVSFAEIARLRGHSTETLRAVDFETRSVLQPWEDPVTLAANAAKPLVEAPDEFGLLVVCTETGLDFGKPLSSYLHRALGLASACKNFEVKHACYAGTAGLRLACDWVRGPSARGRKALVVMTDVARRHEDVSELTAGIGAVALAVSAAPRLLVIEPHSGTAASETYDVARPTPSGEWIDPVLSLASYLDLFESAWTDFASTGGVSLSDFAMFAYHCPLVSLAKRAHALHCELDGVFEAAAVDASFQNRVAPGLRYNRRLGNIYSGSLYLSLLALAETGLAPQSRVGCFSYGSGACAEFFAAVTTESTAHLARAVCLARSLDLRQTIDLDTYLEMSRATEQQLLARNMAVDLDRAPAGRLALAEVRDHHRLYQWL